MFDAICTFPLSSDLFAQAVHPTEPLLTVGLSSGHVATYRLPPVDEENDDKEEPQPSGRRGSTGTDTVDTTWRTRRHKGSCRCLAYSVDGRQVFSAGTDGIAKAADSETGKVTGKIALPLATSGAKEEVDAPTVIHALSPQTLLLSCLYVTGMPAKKSSGSTGEKAVVGGGDGVITLWEKGQWDDQDERIIVSREKETLDCMAYVPDGIGGLGKKIAVGMGDGRVRVVRLGMNKVVSEVMHDEIEGVVQLDFDAGGRMISGGGQTIKVWQEAIAGEQDEDDEDEEGVSTKRAASDDEDSDDDDADSSGDEGKGRKRRKKRKRGKGPTSSNSLSFAGLD